MPRIVKGDNNYISLCYVASCLSAATHRTIYFTNKITFMNCYYYYHLPSSSSSSSSSVKSIKSKKHVVLEDCLTHVILVARQFLPLPSSPLNSWSVVTFSAFYGRKNERKNVILKLLNNLASRHLGCISVIKSTKFTIRTSCMIGDTIQQSGLIK